MACNENLLVAILQLSGTEYDKGCWSIDAEVSDLLVRISRENLGAFKDLTEKECADKIVRVIWQTTKVEIPKEYNSDFWNSEVGVRVSGKMDKILPELPKIRKITK